MQFAVSKTTSTFLPFAFVLAGIAFSPLFFTGAFLLFGAQIAKKNKPLGIGVAVGGLVYFMLVFGYGIGKDLALRDNARPVSAVLSNSP